MTVVSLRQGSNQEATTEERLEEYHRLMRQKDDEIATARQEIVALKESTSRALKDSGYSVTTYKMEAEMARRKQATATLAFQEQADANDKHHHSERARLSAALAGAVDVQKRAKVDAEKLRVKYETLLVETAPRTTSLDQDNLAVDLLSSPSSSSGEPSHDHEETPTVSNQHPTYSQALRVQTEKRTKGWMAFFARGIES
jgi:hypothetical protein